MVAGGAEISVDVVLAEPGVGERAAGAFGMELEQRLVVGLARRVLENPDDIGLALDAHRDLVLPLTGVTVGKDGIPFDAPGQSQIAAMPPAHDNARLCPRLFLLFF